MHGKMVLRAVQLLVVIGLTVAVIMAPGAAWSQRLFSPSVTRELDASIARIIEQDKLPSVAVRAAMPGRGRYVFVGGVAVLRTRTPRRDDQPFRIASVTKTFVATAVLQLVDREKLRTTDVVGRWFPDFPNADKITVDDLMRMRSGIAAQTEDEFVDAIFDDPTKAALSLAEQMAQAAEQRDRFKPPGQVGVYANLDYLMLGEIIRQVTGRDAGTFVTENIVRKLDLRHTSYPTSYELPGGLHGYGWNTTDNRFRDKTRFNPALAGAAGAMISSLADLDRFVRVACTGRLLAPATQRARMEGQALAASTTLYGAGIITGPGRCGHSGTVPGFATDMYYFAELDATLVISVNRLDRDAKARTASIGRLMLDALRSRATSHER